MDKDHNNDDEVDPLINLQAAEEVIDEQASTNSDTNSAVLDLMNNEGPEYVMEHTIEVLAKTKKKLQQKKHEPRVYEEIEGALEEDEDEDISHIWFKETQAKFQGKPWYARPTVSGLLFVLVLRVLCSTLLMTPTVGLLSAKLCDEFAFDKNVTLSNSGGIFDKKRCDMKAVQKEQSNITSWVTLINSVVGIALGGKYGEFSDRLGRVFVLKLMGFIAIFHTLLMLFAFHPARPFKREYVMLAMTSDITGGILTLISVGNAYISDIISPTEGTLAVYISLLMSIIYGSLGFGPLLSSYMIKAFNGNLIVPYYFTVGISVSYLVLLFCFVQESRHKDAQHYSKKVLRKNRLRRKSSISSFRTKSSEGSRTNNKQTALSIGDRLYVWLHMTVIEALEPIGKLWIGRTATGSLIPRINTILLIVVDTLFCSATSAFVPVIMLYSLVAFDWTSVELGYYISICGLGRSAILLSMPLFLESLKKKLRFDVILNGVDRMDKYLLNVSMVFLVLSCLSLIVFRDHGWSLYVSAVFQTLSAVISPTIQSCILKYSSKKISGQVFAAHTQLRHLTMVFVPIIFLQTYSHMYDTHPLLILSIPAVLSVSGLLLLQFVRIVEDTSLLRRESEVAHLAGQSALESGLKDYYGSMRQSVESLSSTSAAGTSARNEHPSLGGRRPSVLNRTE